jgi:hypothetical protein
MDGLKKISLLIVMGIAACGGVDLGQGTGAGSIDSSVTTGISPPVITAVAPTTAARGAAVVVSGFGYSLVPQYNVITIGTGADAIAVTATAYGVVSPATPGNLETLTFTVPATAPLGAQTIFVTVLTNTGNASVTLTVTP